MSSAEQQLRKELLQTGVQAAEIDELTGIATLLSLLKDSTRDQSKHWTRILMPMLLSASSLVVGAVIIMSAQSVGPASWLYSVQRLSDSVAIKVHPQYRLNVMMRRAQQINQLVASHASSPIILDTLNNYQTEATDYKTRYGYKQGDNYRAFEYCHTVLQQAAAKAPANIRQAINDSLKSLNVT